MQGYSSEEEISPSIVIMEEYSSEVGLGEPLGQVDPEEHQIAPFKYIGALEMQAKPLKGKVFRGSGILISSNLVLTAAHNVWCQMANQEFSSIKFYPGVCGFLDESQCYQCSILYYPQKHQTSKVPKHDYALLQLNQPIEKLEKDEFLPLSSSLEHGDFKDANKKILAIYGYPLSSYKKKSLSMTFKTKQWGLTSSLKLLELDQKKARITHEISTEEGQSGCPIIEVGPNQTFSIVGVHKGSVKAKVGEEEKSLNVARIMTKELIETLKIQIEKRRPRLFKTLEKPVQIPLEKKGKQMETQTEQIVPPKKDNPDIINQLNKARAEIARLTQQIINSNENISKLQNRQLTTQSQLRIMTQQYQSSKNQISSLQYILTSLQKQYDADQSQIIKLTKSCKAAQGQILTLNTKYTQAQQQITTLNKQYTEAQNKSQQIQSQLKSITKDYQSSKNQISSLNDKYSNTNFELISMRKQCNADQSRIRTLTEKCQFAQEKIFTLETKYTQAKQEITTLNNQITEEKIKSSQSNLTSEYQVTKEEVKSLKDPKKIKENQSKLFFNFLNQLQSFSIYNPIPKQGNLKYVAIIGETSAGKSSIYNKIFGLNFKNGQGEVTQNIEIIYKDVQNNRVYFDAPGLNENIEIIDAQVLKAFYQIDCVFIVTDRTFKFSKRAIQVMNQINPPQMTLVRTKCDLFTSDADFERVKKQDRDNLVSFGVNCQVLYISVFKPDSFLDNLKFKKLMKGE